MANGDTQHLLAHKHVGTGEQLHSARPSTLEAAINLASELELIRELEHSQTRPVARVHGVFTSNDAQMAILLETVESFSQEVRALQVTIQNLTKSQANKRIPSSF